MVTGSVGEDNYLHAMAVC